MSRNKMAALFVFVAAVALWLIVAWPAAPTPEPRRAGDSDAGAAAEPIAPSPPPMAAENNQAGSEAVPSSEPTQPPPTPPAPPTAAASARELPELIQGDQGPVAEYRKLFESEPRSSSADELETQIRSAFPADDGAPEMFKSVLCRETICRIELRWSQDRRRAWMVGLSRLGRGPYKNAGFQAQLALSPIGPPNKQGTRLVEVYMKRRPPGQEPPH